MIPRTALEGGCGMGQVEGTQEPVLARHEGLLLLVHVQAREKSICGSLLKRGPT